MFDFRLKVFDTVAKRLNFTKAANELNITQPAVSKHIKEIEQQLNTRLIDRNGTKIRLTNAGEVLLKYTEKIFAVYRELEYEINQLNEKHKGSLRIGASTTIAQYVLPPILSAFHKRYDEVKVTMVIHNTEEIENLLENKKIDLGLIEGASKRKIFNYTTFIKDEIVLTARAQHPLASKNSLKINELIRQPLIMREPGSGTLETIRLALKHAGINLSDLQIETQLGNTESIKSYLLHSDCMAFLSMHSILQELKNKTIRVVGLENISIDRYFKFIQLMGEQSAVSELFIRFAQKFQTG